MEAKHLSMLIFACLYTPYPEALGQYDRKENLSPVQTNCRTEPIPQSVAFSIPPPSSPAESVTNRRDNAEVHCLRHTLDYRQLTRGEVKHIGKGVLERWKMKIMRLRF